MNREPLPPVLKLNVSGSIFYIKTSLITHDDRPLAKMFNSDFDRPYKLDDGSYYIEAHPECFQAILNFYRHGRLQQPSTVDRVFFEEQLAFWSIDFSSDEESDPQVGDLVSRMGWPAIYEKQIGSSVPEWFTLAVHVGPGHVGWVPDDLDIFMVCAIHSEEPYTLSIGTDVRIQWPLEEPIIPSWMIGGKLEGVSMGYQWVLDDILSGRYYTADFLISSDVEQVVLLKCTTKRIEDPVRWLGWIDSRIQTRDCYCVNDRMRASVEALHHFDDYAWEDNDIQPKFKRLVEDRRTFF
jgi:BTB/POZ domain